MVIDKAYKFRIYPNQAQVPLINETIGCSIISYPYRITHAKRKEKV
ncbi:Uncharacterized protein BWINRA5_00451 [Bacillus mycoides]|uniref:Transposase putative helix-turn-helix domain-containing protein n=1 Tax=Bacillus cereus HuA2-1 TaxID=1053201 RepID=J9BWK9_BACCE|nr:hypothetical protein IG3_02889 [Bacillus cereus HuA2-1]SCA97126.1 Uncharacterized protein BWINRA5_00451 [Bacillus mycoides]